MDKIAVLVPCYNEEKTIEKVIRDFHSFIPEAHIYVYDNNSTDKTSEIVSRIQYGGGTAYCSLKQEFKQGKGNVVRRMFQDIDAECYILVDGDDTYPAEAAPKMVKEVLERHVDMVIGDRLSSTYFAENKRRFHNFGNSFVRSSINKIFNSDIQDIMTGYRAFSYRFVKTFPVLSKGFEIETEMTIHAISNNMSLENVVIEYKDRPEGSVSKLNTVSDGFKVIRTIFNLFRNYKPLQFFSFIGVGLLLISIGVFIPAVWIPYTKTGLVDRFPTLIVCGLVSISALLSFFNGMILDSIVQKDRRAFEFRLVIADCMYKRIISTCILNMEDNQQ